MSHARLDILFLLLFPLFFLVFNLVRDLPTQKVFFLALLIFLFLQVYWLSFLYGTCSNCDAPVYTAGVPQACTSGPAPLPGEEESSSSYSESSSSPPTLLEQGFIV